MKKVLLVLLAAFGLFYALEAQNLQRIGHLSYGSVELSGCWHHVDQSGGEWALVGTGLGLSIVDLSDPTQPVERFSVPGLINNWREMRTWQGYAYVCSEAIPSGITIVNLNYLPDSIQTKVWRGDGFFVDRIKESHTIQAVDGHLYMFGGSDLTDGAIIAKITDPWNPQILSKYSAHYVHDGFIRGDTLWTNEGNASRVGVIDVSNKTNPVLLLTIPLTGGYSHNCELSADGQTLFTTEETTGAPLSAFDVSNLEDIKLLDEYRPSKKPLGEVHNVRVRSDGFLVCPSYRGQLTIVDATQPDNMIEIAWDSLGTSLIWDADPYLPSGILPVTAKKEGFFVYQPTYKPAARLQGLVTDASTGLPLLNAKVLLLNTPNGDTTGLDGVYKTGAAGTGLYALRVEKEGYLPQVLTDVQLTSGVTTFRNFALSSLLGTEELENEWLVKVSPSPFEDVLRVEFPEGSAYKTGKTRLILSDALGKTIQAQAADESGVTRFSGLKNLPAGAYLLQIEQENTRPQMIQVLKN